MKENKKKRHKLTQFSLFPSSTTGCLGDKRAFFNSGSLLTLQRITSRIILSLHLFPLKTNNKASISTITYHIQIYKQKKIYKFKQASQCPHVLIFQWSYSFDEVEILFTVSGEASFRENWLIWTGPF